MYILDNQYVSVPEFNLGSNEHVRKVCKGSGMGLAVSGSVADKALFELAERGFVTNAMILKKFRIHAFYQYGMLHCQRVGLCLPFPHRTVLTIFESHVLRGCVQHPLLDDRAPP